MGFNRAGCAYSAAYHIGVRIAVSMPEQNPGVGVLAFAGEPARDLDGW